MPIIRSGDLSTDVQVECLTIDETANSNVDFVPRLKNNLNSNLVKIPAGEIYGFCDIEIIDDDLNEIQTEYFKTYLSSASPGTRIGFKSEARIGIIGPNDLLVNDCKTVYQTISSKETKIALEITREKNSLNETLEVLVENIPTSDIYIKSYLNNADSLKENNIIKTNIQQVFNERSLLNFGNSKNISLALANKHFEPFSTRLKFLPGEILKVILV